MKNTLGKLPFRKKLLGKYHTLSYNTCAVCIAQVFHRLSLDPMSFDPRSFYPMSFDPRSFYPMSFDPRSFTLCHLTLGRLPYVI